MPRYVLLYHDCPPNYHRRSHWDLMLESGAMLRTWALARLPHDWRAAHEKTFEACKACPPIAAENSVVAEPLADHRLAYLEFEGPLSGDRGHVVQVAAGAYDSKSQSSHFWQIELTGGLTGTITLRQLTPENPMWMLTHQPSS